MDDGQKIYIDREIMDALASGNGTHADATVRLEAARRGISLTLPNPNDLHNEAADPSFLDPLLIKMERFWDRLPVWSFFLLAAIGALVSALGLLNAGAYSTDSLAIGAIIGAAVGGMLVPLLRVLSEWLLILGLCAIILLIGFVLMNGG